jgi:replicative DNA helicase
LRGNREQEISSISRALKSLAKELSIPIIALSQLSRAVEQRGGAKRPQLSDLRESGAIEQDADMVLFVYREDYYDMEDPESHPGSAEVIIAKHRNGPLDSVHLRFLKEFAKFVEEEPSLSDYHYPADTPEPRTITRGSKMNDIEEEGPF